MSAKAKEGRCPDEAVAVTVEDFMFILFAILFSFLLLQFSYFGVKSKILHVVWN